MKQSINLFFFSFFYCGFCFFGRGGGGVYCRKEELSSIERQVTRHRRERERERERVEGSRTRQWQ